MMDISNLTDQAKSVLLAKAMGCYKEEASMEQMELFYGKTWRHRDTWMVWRDCNDRWMPQGLPDLYDPANMALAWRVHLWGLQAVFWTEYYRWWRSPKDRPYIYANAACLWLDKILELAIEAGLVELDEEKG